jgi:hypothetical protein
VRIITNNKRRDLISLNDLPAKVQQEFDYVREDGDYSPRFVKYKGAWYDAYDTQGIDVSDTRTKPLGWAMMVKSDDPFAKWHAVISETFFSGVLFRFDGDQVIVGRYYS